MAKRKRQTTISRERLDEFEDLVQKCADCHEVFVQWTWLCDEYNPSTTIVWLSESAKRLILGGITTFSSQKNFFERLKTCRWNLSSEKLVNIFGYEALISYSFMKKLDNFSTQLHDTKHSWDVAYATLERYRDARQCSNKPNLGASKHRDWAPVDVTKALASLRPGARSHEDEDAVAVVSAHENNVDDDATSARDNNEPMVRKRLRRNALSPFSLSRSVSVEIARRPPSPLYDSDYESVWDGANDFDSAHELEIERAETEPFPDDAPLSVPVDDSSLTAPGDDSTFLLHGHSTLSVHVAPTVPVPGGAPSAPITIDNEPVDTNQDINEAKRRNLTIRRLDGTADGGWLAHDDLDRILGAILPPRTRYYLLPDSDSNTDWEIWQKQRYKSPLNSDDQVYAILYSAKQKHWSMLNVDTANLRVYSHDSLCFESAIKSDGSALHKIANCFVAKLGLEWNEDWGLIQAATPRQPDASSCGVFAIVCILHLMTSQRLPTHLHPPLWRFLFQQALLKEARLIPPKCKPHVSEVRDARAIFERICVATNLERPTLEVAKLAEKTSVLRNNVIPQLETLCQKEDGGCICTRPDTDKPCGKLAAAHFGLLVELAATQKDLEADRRYSQIVDGCRFAQDALDAILERHSKEAVVGREKKRAELAKRIKKMDEEKKALEAELAHL